MTTSPVVSITDDLIAELELDVQVFTEMRMPGIMVVPGLLAALLAERADLRRQLSAASVDAGRYRFLRNESVNADGDTVMAAKIDGAGDQISNWFFGAGLDAAIDAARNIGSGD